MAKRGRPKTETVRSYEGVEFKINHVYKRKCRECECTAGLHYFYPYLKGNDVKEGALLCDTHRQDEPELMHKEIRRIDVKD